VSEKVIWTYCDGCGKRKPALLLGTYEDTPLGWIRIVLEAGRSPYQFWHYHSWKCLREALEQKTIGRPRKWSIVPARPRGSAPRIKGLR
jgi:hypothetical protein